MLTLKRNDSGQALLEIALLLPLMATFVFGIIDFSRAMYDGEVLRNMAGEGSSLASRTASPADTVAALMSDPDLNMNSFGCVIVTSVQAGSTANSYVVTGQAKSNPCHSGTSKVGCYPPPSSCGTATVPSGVQLLLQNSPNATVFVTEVYYNFNTTTPIGNFLHNSSLLPSQMYSAAYY